eukprot:jgi/Tetstr1/466138/TSEL_010700.t1
MADHAAAAAAAAPAGFEAMKIDTHVAPVIQVELAKTKTRVPTRDIINASRILGDRHIDDFESKLVACFHSNSNMHGATALRIAPNHPHLHGTAIKLAQHLRRTFDLLPVHRRYDEFPVVGVIQACLPHSAQVALEADEPIDSYTAICRHLEAIDLEFAAATNGKRKYAADAPPHRYIRPGAGPFPPAGPSTPSPPSRPHTRHPPPFWL